MAQTELSTPVNPKSSRNRQSQPGGTQQACPAHSSLVCLSLPRDRKPGDETRHPTAAGGWLQGKAGPTAHINLTGRAANIFLSPSGAKTCTYPSLSFFEFLMCSKESALAACAFWQMPRYWVPHFHNLKVRNHMPAANRNGWFSSPCFWVQTRQD